MSSIFKSSRANKRGLSLLLDRTLKSHHDMKVFGLGALSEFSLPSYQRFACSRYHFYTALERRFDAAPASSSIHRIWSTYQATLRQSPCLASDLAEVSIPSPSSLPPCPSTRRYVDDIESSSPDELVGHFYTRYFADLFGGSMLGAPTSLSLGVPPPSFYSFEGVTKDNRPAYIEGIYERLNESGEAMGEGGREAAVDATRRAFRWNADVIKEAGLLYLSEHAARGIVNVGSGYLRSKN
ncbi:hypothetical protein TeGR_g47 [Tetraparma gracilis]|uniref:Heme oxygenase n=1 Tax=Tetraparma gracilis TaxID=2962635 RepID=A0ABQ6NEW4_9STRA|nr:hypothetical protein TeGR_g47 [Tetraparma gracilis]